jgi:HSP20 family molecular chaperone IbpA
MTSLFLQVVKIYFPGSKMADLDLDVTRDRIKAESSKFKLFTYLPTAVKHKDGTASFDSKAEVLTVTLPIINELLE